ncbi:Gti1/Pac2 family-domain-containing protein [Roridomyces roridus]|uniref:Gti1/Pac2 family-domain-containing protein n=1 Tax=Roridomyces roridus TaxID=1738132 RepID=A0AAD7FHD1_9AGAR|nr:Gti1/Pac2 family-domain-containing protein [Roridomyces roridus]
MPNQRASFITHPALHIRDITDAHRVLEAVRLKLLPLVKRRLVAHERAQLQSGNVFVWEESEYEDGLVRWTEGRRWSQSKMRGECLRYEEKIEMTEAEKLDKAARRALARGRIAFPPPRPSRRDRPSKVGGLIKQTYSVTVRLPDSVATVKKWHVVSYSSVKDADTLPVVEDYPYLRDIRVPAGVFLSSHNAGRLINGSLEKFPAPAPAHVRVDVPIQSYRYQVWKHVCPPLDVELRSPGMDSDEGDSSSSDGHEDDHGALHILPAISSPHSRVTLPSLSSLGVLLPGTSFPSPSSTSMCYYDGDDRRVLDRFRIAI